MSKLLGDYRLAICDSLKLQVDCSRLNCPNADTHQDVHITKK
jgi:hypothetical protein